MKDVVMKNNVTKKEEEERDEERMVSEDTDEDNIPIASLKKKSKRKVKEEDKEESTKSSPPSSSTSSSTTLDQKKNSASILRENRSMERNKKTLTEEKLPRENKAQQDGIINNENDSKSNASDTPKNNRYSASIKATSQRTERLWQTNFQKLIKYQQINGQQPMPPPRSTLGRWIERQRMKYKLRDSPTSLLQDLRTTTLSQTQIDLLLSVGIDLQPHYDPRPTWDSTFQQLQEYIAKEGRDALPPHKTTHLGRWVVRQRCKYKHRKSPGCNGFGAISKCQIGKLNRIHFRWVGKAGLSLLHDGDGGGLCSSSDDDDGIDVPLPPPRRNHSNRNKVRTIKQEIKLEEEEEEEEDGSLNGKYYDSSSEEEDKSIQDDLQDLQDDDIDDEDNVDDNQENVDDNQENVDNNPYLLLRAQRIARNQQRLESLGLLHQHTDKKIKKNKKKKRKLNHESGSTTNSNLSIIRRSSPRKKQTKVSTYNEDELFGVNEENMI